MPPFEMTSFEPDPELDDADEYPHKNWNEP